MALQVWLPLNGDTRQQGLSNISVAGNPAAWNNGKIGKCAYWNGAVANAIYNNTTDFNYTNNFSVAFWINPVFTSGSTQYAWTVGRADAGGYGYGFQIANATDGYFRFGNGTYAVNMPSNQWNHYVMTVGNNKVTTYKNGIQTSQNNLPGTIPTYSDGNGMGLGCFHYSSNIYPFYGSMNDFRIYDHCLSPMEVKELAKGLVLHYPLDRQGWGQDNILLNTGFQSRYTQSTGWDTTKNGTQLASSWGGYNSGVGNQATVYHAHLKEFNGEWVYEYVKTANESWLGISQGGLQSKLTAGKTYTFSWEEYHVDGTNRVGTGLYYFKTDATSANFHLGIQQASDITRIIGKWQKYTYTFVAPSDADWSKNMSWYIYGHYNNNGTFYMRHPKLEEGSIATPWTPNSSDALATTMGLNSTTEYDCSGFCNNGTRTGIFTWTSDTPKYQVSTYFADYTRKLRTPLVLTPTAITMAVWIKSSTSGRGSYHMPLNIDGAAYEFSIGSDGKFRNGFYINGSRIVDTVNSKNVLDGQWHHLCATYDGTTIKRYVDGVSVSGGDHSAAGTLTSTLMLYVGDYGTNETYGNNQIYESDIRIYATALSADDVKSLYQNCATIDPDGTIRGQIRS